MPHNLCMLGSWWPSSSAIGWLKSGTSLKCGGKTWLPHHPRPLIFGDAAALGFYPTHVLLDMFIWCMSEKGKWAAVSTTPLWHRVDTRYKWVSWQNLSLLPFPLYMKQNKICTQFEADLVHVQCSCASPAVGSRPLKADALMCNTLNNNNVRLHWD
jgi:hypothetical protein